MYQDPEMEFRRRPLVDVPTMYERISSIYPEAVLIPMEDGATIEYRIVVAQPTPRTRRAEKSDRRGYPHSGQTRQ